MVEQPPSNMPLGFQPPPPKKSYKKPILITIATLAGVCLLAATGWYLYFILQFSVYQDNTYKFSIKYPKSWKVVPQPQANVAVVFLRPKDTALDILQENFNVTVQPLPPGDRTLDSFSTAIKKQMTAVFDKNITIVEDKPVKLGWRGGHEIVFRAEKPEHLQMVNAWVLRGDKVYILTFLGDMNKFSKEKPYIDEMIGSLQLL